MRLAVLVVLLLCAACGRERSIIGEWSTRTDQGEGTMTFRADWTFESEVRGPTGNLSLTGSYSVEGDRLTMRARKWSVAAKRSLTAEEREYTSWMLADPRTLTVNWTDDDHFRLVAQGQFTTAERIRK